MDITNKPKIFAHCPAGCKWETVHKSDFEQSATYIPAYPNADNTFTLKKGVEYKIFALKSDPAAFDCSIDIKSASGNTPDYNIEIGEADEYADCFTFRLLDVLQNKIVYEIAGVRYEETIAAANLSENAIVYGAERVYQYNSDASVVVRNLSEEVLAMLTDMDKTLDTIIAMEESIIRG